MERSLYRLIFATVILVSAQPLAQVAQAKDDFFLKNGQRVVFLGDSNTYAGTFIAYLDAYLFTQFPDWKVELINLGLPSETASGLSEPDHPYPRPCVHERLARALARTKPDVVVACYGMNDGIYYPDSDERFARYKEGMEKLIDRCRKAGAKVVLMTPAPFDPAPLKGKTLPRAATKFSWLHPFEGYDGALTRYSDWLLTLRKRGFPVADPHTAINRGLTMVRKSDPKFFISGDGIHPSPTGHWLVARQLLRALNAPVDLDSAAIDARTLKVVSGKVSGLAREGQTLRFTWQTRRPLPADPHWDPRLADGKKIVAHWSPQGLTITGLAPGQYMLAEGQKRLGEVTREQLAAGVSLSQFTDLSTVRRSAELWKLVEKRQRLLGPAWLDEVGHKRPDTPKGLPLREAQRQAAELEARIRKLAKPASISLRLAPVKDRKNR
jgi:lysophospholipase L1-like esterase